MKLDILAFAAHPDDVELACSGILHSHIKMGKKVGVVDLTRGQLGSRGSIELRQQEANKASEIMGLHVRENLGMEDGFFQNDKAHQLQIVQILRKYQPEMILVNAPYDRHPDHEKGARLVLDSCFFSGLLKVETLDTQTGEPQKIWKPRRMFHYIQDVYIEPSLIVDITDSFQVKLNAINAFGSQFFNPESMEGPQTYISNQGFLDEIESRALSMGKRIGVKYGEGLVRPMCQHIGFKSLFDQILPEFT
jgi:N-acetylglucosamine malate deacetylase 1